MNPLLGQLGLAGTAVSIVVSIIYMILTGRLVPRRQLDDQRQAGEARVADRDLQLVATRAERDTWREAHAESERARMVALTQNAESLELARTTVHLLQAFPRPVGQGQEVTASAPVAQLPAASS